MRSLHVTALTGPSGVVVAEVPAPSYVEGQVLIDVHAVGVSWPDLLMTKGEYQIKQEPPFTFGSDCAGVVVEAPEGSGFVPGDRVAATYFGVGSERISVPSDFVFPLPDALSFAEGAALPINYLTAHFALAVRAGLRADETVLINGAAGGVGTACIEFAKAFGARVIAVVSNEEKAAFARAAGADETVMVDGFLAEVKELTDGRGVDIVVDVVGGDLMTDNLRALAALGRVLVIGFAGGSIPVVKVNRLLLNNIDVRGVAWGEYAYQRPGYMREQWNELVPLIEKGLIKPPIGKLYPMEGTVDALVEMESRGTLGKSVLSLR
jgi:NADPH2:quinone reductase